MKDKVGIGLPLYTRAMHVAAIQIKMVNFEKNELVLCNEASIPVIGVTKKWMEWYNPKVGDYFVVRADGVTYTEPTNTFEMQYVSEK